MSSPSQSLQRTEAVARRELLEVHDYDLRLDLASDEKTFGSVTTIRFSSRGGATFLDLKPVRRQRDPPQRRTRSTPTCSTAAGCRSRPSRATTSSSSTP